MGTIYRMVRNDKLGLYQQPTTSAVGMEELYEGHIGQHKLAGFGIGRGRLVQSADCWF